MQCSSVYIFFLHNSIEPFCVWSNNSFFYLRNLPEGSRFRSHRLVSRMSSPMNGCGDNYPFLYLVQRITVESLFAWHKNWRRSPKWLLFFSKIEITWKERIWNQFLRCKSAAWSDPKKLFASPDSDTIFVWEMKLNRMAKARDRLQLTHVVWS